MLRLMVRAQKVQAQKVQAQNARARKDEFRKTLGSPRYPAAQPELRRLRPARAESPTAGHYLWTEVQSSFVSQVRTPRPRHP
jgi:hypothetical protein